MANDWQPLEPDEVAIAHVSDPHFGSPNAEEVWLHAKKWLKEIGPCLRLVLVTGDLVHTPDESWYTFAKKQLNDLGIPYFVCSGNHDRHKLGNRVPKDLLMHQWVRRAEMIVQATLWIIGLTNIALMSFCFGWIFGVPSLAVTGLLSWFFWKAPGYPLKHFDLGYTNAKFDQVFQQEILGSQRAAYRSFEGGDEPWSLGLLGLDSSVDVDFFARGKVQTSQLAELAKATCQINVEKTDRKEFDLCILLVHHHLLPIRLKEPERAFKVEDLVNATCLMNSGTVLEELSRARVDIVLHGHEHKHNWAVYSSLNHSYGPVRVVAAGSTTGNDSLNGCTEKDATLNVLILRPNRSVRLRRMMLVDGVWKQDDDLLLLSGEDVRQSRVRRKAMRDSSDAFTPQAMITSEIIKTAIFTSARDIEVYWILTDWWLQGPEFQWPVFNSTGRPSNRVEVFLVGAAGKIKIEDAEFLQGAQDHSWYLRFTVPDGFRRKRVRVIMQYRWEGGALLTIEELKMVRSGRPLGIPRSQNLEFSTIWANGQPVAALELNVSLPPEYSQENEDEAVQLFIHDDFQNWTDWKAKYRGEAAELRQRLRLLADGRYSLRVPFPSVDRKYTLAWEPVTEQKAAARLQNRKFSALFAALSKPQTEALLRTFGEAFQNTPLWNHSTLAFFVKAHDSSTVEYRGGTHLGAPNFIPRHPLPPLQSVDVKSERSLLVQAWWGSPMAEPRPAQDEVAREFGFCENEGHLLCIPVRSSFYPTNPPPWVIIRIGVWNEGLELNEAKAEDKIEQLLYAGDRINQLLYTAQAKLLAEALKG